MLEEKITEENAAIDKENAQIDKENAQVDKDNAAVESVGDEAAKHEAIDKELAEKPQDLVAIGVKATVEWQDSTGNILELTTPGGFGVRLDHGIRAGLEITPYYDPLLGKLCCWGADRSEALGRMSRALEELRIIGLRTTIPFCIAVLTNKDFAAGRYDTSFIGKHSQALAQYQRQSQSELEEAAAIGTVLFAEGDNSVAARRQANSSDVTQWLHQGRSRQRS